MGLIQPCSLEHVERYGEIYAKAFSGEPWNDPWDPAYQRRGIAKMLLERCLADMKARGIVGVHLITAGEGILPAFYEKYGFKKENEVILMGLEMDE